MNRLITFTALLAVVLIRVSRADCPLDHLKIGCNPDGVWGTPDDNRLFVDCAQKYRHSDPSSPSDPAWLHWHYPMYYNVRYNRYEIGEPGFDLLCEDEDPNRALVGTPNVDFRIVIECVSIRSGFSARNATLGILLDEAGDSFNHSELFDPHVHMEYRAAAPDGAEKLHWITFRLRDDLGGYQSSGEFSVVFIRDPLDGDLVIDGTVNPLDLQQFASYWLNGSGDYVNDFHERADINRDSRVDLLDFQKLARQWLSSVP